MELVTYISAVANDKILVNSELCKGCGLCVKFCPKGVLQEGTTINALGYKGVQVCSGNCIACGNCFYICPEPGAISVRKESTIPMPEPKRRVA